MTTNYHKLLSKANGGANQRSLMPSGERKALFFCPTLSLAEPPPLRYNIPIDPRIDGGGTLKGIKMIQISGLWLNETKDGKKYMSGYMGEAKILIFRNEYKESENQPDYRMYIAPKRDPMMDEAEQLGGKRVDNVDF